MAKKIDLSNFKQFLIDKGEKVALGVCGAVALLLLVLGILNFFQARQLDYKKNLEDSATQLLARINKAEYTPPEVPTLEIEWSKREPTFQQVPFSPFGDKGDNKRRNPNILPVNVKQFDVAFIRCGSFGYQVDVKNKKIYLFKGAKVGGGGEMPDMKAGPKNTDGNFIKDLQPLDMVVVSTVFPMRQQIESYSRDLRMPLAELLSRKDDLPKPLSLNIYRQEIKDGKETGWQPLYVHVPSMDKAKRKDQIKVAEPIDKLLSRTFIEEENPRGLQKYIMRGLVTPLPRLGNLRYPRLKLEGIQEPEVVADAGDDPKVPKFDMPKGPDMPKGKANFPGPKSGINPKMVLGGNEGTPDPKKWADANLPKELKERFLDDYNTFDPFASFEEQKGTGPGGNPQGGPPPGFDNKDKLDPKMMGKDPKEGKPQAAAINDLLVRFIDVGVEPGKTYQYSIQVRMENPNFGKKDLVSSALLADEKERFSPFVSSPPITIPGEYAFFAVDQMPEPTGDPKIKPLTPGPDTDPIKMQPNSNPPYPLKTTIQIHKFVPQVDADTGPPYQTADWAIAVRVLVGRGEFIGRSGMFVEVPVWRPLRNGFEVGNVAFDKKKGSPKVTGGLPINFQLMPPPLLIDFDGGKVKKPAATGLPAIPDESAIEILIMNPDGKLLLRNSRDDSDPEHIDGEARIQRLNSYRDRLRQVRSQGQGNPGGEGVKMPAGK